MSPRALKLANKYLHERLDREYREYLRDFDKNLDFSPKSQRLSNYLLKHLSTIEYYMISGELTMKDFSDFMEHDKPLSFYSRNFCHGKKLEDDFQSPEERYHSAMLILKGYFDSIDPKDENYTEKCQTILDCSNFIQQKLQIKSKSLVKSKDQNIR